MKRVSRALVTFVFLFTVVGVRAEQPTSTIPVAMLSDLHFDPFHDPAKVPQLIKAPVEKWPEILSSPDSATQAADFATVQKACKSKLEDVPYALMTSALQAAKEEHPRFVTVTGDLLVHTFDCRYRAALKLPPDSADDQSVSAEFVAKTTVFVMKQLASTFKGIPVYIALGNNDSRCNHNRLDLNDPYLKATSHAAIDALAGIKKSERKHALETYESAGYYGVTMAAPMKNTRLLVLDDIYMMTKYANCEANEKDEKGADEQIAWLNAQLNEAQKSGQQVWVMGHLPPMINAFSTLSKGKAICSGAAITEYLFTDKLTTAITSHAEIIRLALFGHSHMDEFALLGNGSAGVPLKVIGSVTAVSGNVPSFTISQVQPQTATLMDYSVYLASNPSGAGTKWDLEYRFGDAYHEPEFTAKSLDQLIARFVADASSSTAESLAYQTHYFKGAPLRALAPFWPEYVCSMNHTNAADFKACACKGK